MKALEIENLLRLGECRIWYVEIILYNVMFLFKMLLMFFFCVFSIVFEWNLSLVVILWDR